MGKLLTKTSMMKSYLIAVSLCFSCLAGNAQSLSFGELESLTSLTNDQVHNYLLLEKGFKPIGKQQVNGKNFELFSSSRTDPAKAETVFLGESGVHTYGNVSRQVFYKTRRIQDINVILQQAKQSSLALNFVGSDRDKSIYRFDNSLFMALISIGSDKKYGSVQLEEK
jgi:hypothetical protein